MQQVENELLWFFRVSLSYMFMEFWKLVKSNDVLEKCAQSSVSTLFVALSRHGNKKGNITLFYLKIKVKELAYNGNLILLPTQTCHFSQQFQKCWPNYLDIFLMLWWCCRLFQKSWYEQIMLRKVIHKFVIICMQLWRCFYA